MQIWSLGPRFKNEGQAKQHLRNQRIADSWQGGRVDRIIHFGFQIENRSTVPTNTGGKDSFCGARSLQSYRHQSTQIPEGN
jgi:hypothetical protein